MREIQQFCNQHPTLTIVWAVGMWFSVLAICAAAWLRLTVWPKMKLKVGTIRCRRCKYTGESAPRFVIGKGIEAMCPQCRSNDWVSASEKPSSPDSNS